MPARNYVAHKCVNACPVNAIVIIQNKAYIDQGKCIECGKCASECSYNAILENQRPCSRACELDAINSDSNRQAKINRDKGVSCSSFISACPFGALTETSGLVKVALELYLIKAGKNNYSFLEGMACVGGCIGGPSTMINRNKAKKLVQEFADAE